METKTEEVTRMALVRDMREGLSGIVVVMASKMFSTSTEDFESSRDDGDGLAKIDIPLPSRERRECISFSKPLRECHFWIKISRAWAVVVVVKGRGIQSDAGVGGVGGRLFAAVDAEMKCKYISQHSPSLICGSSPIFQTLEDFR